MEESKEPKQPDANAAPRKKSRKPQDEKLTKDMNAYQRDYYDKNADKKKRQHQIRMCYQGKSIVVPSAQIVSMVKVIFANNNQEQLKQELSEAQYAFCQELYEYMIQDVKELSNKK